MLFANVVTNFSFINPGGVYVLSTPNHGACGKITATANGGSVTRVPDTVLLCAGFDEWENYARLLALVSRVQGCTGV